MSGIIAQNTLDNSGLIKSPAGGGAWNFISKVTASSDATIDITSGIDSTYKLYLITYNNMHPETDLVDFQVNFRDGGSAFDAVKTTTVFDASHLESGSSSNLSYSTSYDLAQGTGIQFLASEVGNDNDQSVSGYLYLFNPSDTTFIKHFFGESNTNQGEDRTYRWHVAGYCNTTSAIDGVQFSMQSDAIDSGEVCLYGLTT
jgi:hypothetical protein